MIEIIDVNDRRAVRNKNNIVALYDLMINKKKSEEATAKFVSPAYIQHNPLIADGSVALATSSAGSHGNAPGPASSSTALSPPATMYGRT
jgi:predicted SnoaL-like aldol condensation-catalyzing enzyme